MHKQILTKKNRLNFERKKTRKKQTAELKALLFLYNETMRLQRLIFVQEQIFFLLRYFCAKYP